MASREKYSILFQKLCLRGLCALDFLYTFDNVHCECKLLNLNEYQRKSEKDHCDYVYRFCGFPEFAEIRLSFIFYQTGIIRILRDRMILPDCLTGILTEAIECSIRITRLLRQGDTVYVRAGAHAGQSRFRRGRARRAVGCPAGRGG